MKNVLYAGNVLNPNNFGNNAANVKGSGFHTVILGLCHIGRGQGAHNPVQGQQTGDIIFNHPDGSVNGGMSLVSQGKYVGRSSWPDQLRSLCDPPNSSVRRLGFSFGGGGSAIEDYQTIWTQFVRGDEISSDSVLYRNFAVLREEFKFDFIDLDCEEFLSNFATDYNWWKTVIAFGKMLKKIGFNLTLCPYNNIVEWLIVLNNLYSEKPPTVTGIHLQAYDGGAGNFPSQWARFINRSEMKIDGGSLMVPGLWCCNQEKPAQGSTPDEIQQLLCVFQITSLCAGMGWLQGGFVWNYDDILTNSGSTNCNPNYSGPKSLEAYYDAIKNGLNLIQAPHLLARLRDAGVNTP